MSLIWVTHLQAAMRFPRPLRIRHRFLDTPAQMQVGQCSASSAELKRRFNSAAANLVNATSEIRAFSRPAPASPEKSPQQSQTAGGDATNDMEPGCLLVLRHG